MKVHSRGSTLESHQVGPEQKGYPESTSVAVTRLKTFRFDWCLHKLCLQQDKYIFFSKGVPESFKTFGVLLIRYLMAVQMRLGGSRHVEKQKQ